MINQGKTSSDIQKWQKISSKIVFEHPRMTLVEDRVVLPNGKETEYLCHKPNASGGVVVVCVKDSKILLQQEYSYPIDEVLYQFPGGRIKQDESPLEAANRELSEESSLHVTDLEYIGWFYPDNRRSDAKLHVVFNNGVTEVTTDIEADPEEFIASSWMPISEFKELLKNNQITNFAVLSAWSLLLGRHPEL